VVSDKKLQQKNNTKKKYPNVNIDNGDVWKNEIFQRNAISYGINHIKDLSESDLIIISDLDEIPDPNTLNKIKKGNIIVDINILEMDLYYYNLNTRINEKWFHCKIISYEKYNKLNLSCNDIRMANSTKIVNGGWHLSYFGDKFFIQNKIQNFAHQEFNNSDILNNIENKIEVNSDLFNRQDWTYNDPIQKFYFSKFKVIELDYYDYPEKMIKMIKNKFPYLIK
jgi:beta-1,4-mannosyl-glycoprotein beta-1,4-N-acetylglucosaminyltransferase